MSELLCAVDPGGTTGWAVYDIQSQQPVEMGETKADNISPWLVSMNGISIWVVEDYFVRPPSMQKGGYDHSWDKGETLRIIGKIEHNSFLTSSEFHLVQPSQKVMGYKRIGMEYKKGKGGMHMYDALAHGKLWLEKNFGAR
jgi:hypothetical protein